ncbi:MAG TPA: LuxR C-terminal-related transcriptional regulator, partial [Candidatus Limnocylindrales bacterium]
PFAWVALHHADDDAKHLRNSVARATDPLIARGGEFVIVLDDVQVLRSREAIAVLTALVEEPPPGARLVLASRCEPPLPLGRLRAHREVLELTTRDFVMTRGEAAALLELAGADLAAADVDTLVRRTEGWPAGLYLAAVSLREQPDAATAIARFGGDDRVVSDYVADSLLSELMAEEVAFLRRTSVLDRLSGPLCDAVLDDAGSARTLRDLARANGLVVPLDRTDEWYRYHGLLAELLRIELRRRAPDQVPELHRRAAHWFADRRDMDRAVRHAIAAGDTEQAARWIAASYLQVLEEGRIVTVDGWLDAIGAETVAADQRLAVVRAWTSHFLGRHADGDAALAAAVRAPAVQPMPDGTGSIEASAALIGAAFPGNDAGRMLACAERAFELEAARESPWRVTVHVLLGFGLVRKGSFDEARGPLRLGADLALANEMWMDAVGANTLLARISLETGEAARAEQLGRTAVSLAEERGLGSTATGAYARATLGTILVRRGHAAEGGELIAGALPSARAIGEPLFVAEALIGLAQARRMLGRSEEAAAFLREADAIIDASRDPGYLPALRHAATPVPVVPSTARLSRREIEVLQVLATGASKRQAASRLFVSFNTIHTQLRSVYRKLDVHSLPAAISRARELHLID